MLNASEASARLGIRTRIGAVAVALSLALVCLGAARWRFGSLANARAYLSGQVVRVDEPVRDLGAVKCDEQLKVAFNVVNLQRAPLKVVGANASCTCILPPEMPMTIEPLEPTPLTFTFTAPERATAFEQEIQIYFDGPIPAMLLTIIGQTR